MPSIALPVSLRGQLLSGSRFNPISLFSAGEQGIWLEPSDLSTMFQDRAGTTPVTTPGQAVGLRLDKSKGLTLGSELVTNGDFSGGSTGWTITAPGTNTITISSGSVRFVTNGSADAATLNQPWSGDTAVGKYYRITFNVLSGSTGQLKISTLGVSTVIGEHTFTATPGAKSFTLVSSNASNIGISRVVGQSADATIDNISVKELPGNHAVAPTDAARPTYGIEPWSGRRNLLTRTEEFGDAVWGKNLVTVPSNFDIAPDGTTTADRFVSAGGSFPQIAETQSLVAGQPYTFSAWVKSDGTAQIAQALLLESGVTAFTPTSTWTRVSVSIASSAGGSKAAVIATNSGAAAASSFLIWGAQLELGSTATAYQRVGTAFDVTEAGVPSVSYLSFDGVDDWLVTPTIDPAASAVPGAELVTNGTFASDTNWTKETGWAISGGVASKTSGTAGSLYQGAAAMVQGRTYQIDFTVSGYSAGTLTPFCRGTGGTGVTANGTYSQRIIAGADSVYVINFFAGATFVGSIDNISVREIVADKVQVFAGVRKLSDAAAGLLLETSTSSSAQNGSVGILAPSAPTTDRYDFRSRGTVLSVAATANAAFSAPITNIITGIGDISGDVSRLRINGAQVVETLTDQGTGNYLSYPLYIGRRAGTSLPFNGQIYSLIVRFGANLATDQIASIESSVGSKTGFFAPTITGVPTIGVS